MRLDKCLETAGYGSRNEIKKLIKARQVTVNGLVAHKGSQIVDPVLQEICVKEQRLQAQGAVYYLLNKPSGVVTAVSDELHQTVVDLIAEPDRREGLYPIGRLDRDTEGLIVMTNNGPLGYRMLHPSYHVTKIYEVTVNGFLAYDAVAFFRKGVVFLDGTRCQPAELTILAQGNQESRARLMISEGKFHQVKKMFLAYGLKVTHLKRISFGPFKLDETLALGTYRTLTEKEADDLLAFFD
ncbi:pseudouridine synthase [Streptococcus fryi]